MEIGGTGINLDRGSLSAGLGALATMTGGRIIILEGVRRGDSEGVLLETDEGEVEREAEAAVLLVGALSDSSSSSSLSSSLATTGESTSMAISLSSAFALSSEALANSDSSSGWVFLMFSNDFAKPSFDSVRNLM